MARLSDFQTAPVTRNFEAEKLVMANAGKVRRGIVNWRNTPIMSTEGGIAIYGKDAIAANSRRQRLHTMLDKMMSEKNVTEDRAPRLHAALDKLLDENLGPEDQNRILHEPAEEEGDEEPEEESDDEAEENEKPHAKVRIPTSDEFQRSLDAILGLDGADHSRVIVMDSGSSLKLGEPDANASDAIAKLPIGFDINRRAKAPWFSALFTWIAKHPTGTKIKDLHQPTLQHLLHELKIAA